MRYYRSREEYLKQRARELYDIGYRVGDREELIREYVLTPYEAEVIINELIELEE